MARKPPIPVPSGQKYCFMCEQPLATTAFNMRRGKPVSPCRTCAKKAPERTAEMQRLIEETQEEMRVYFASRPPKPPEEERVYAPMSGFAEWLDHRDARA